jgi:hypothetical protein
MLRKSLYSCRFHGGDHHRFFIKDYLQVKVQLPDRHKDGSIMRSHRCHNALSHRKRNPVLSQIGRKCGEAAGHKSRSSSDAGL